MVNRLVKQDGIWKVAQIIEYIPVESGYTDNLRDHVLKAYDIDKNSTEKGEDGTVYQITDKEAAEILQQLSTTENTAVREAASDLVKKLAAYDMKCLSFEEAYQMARTLNVPNGWACGEVEQHRSKAFSALLLCRRCVFHVVNRDLSFRLHLQ